MSLTVECDLFFYVDDTCLTFQPENVKEIENRLNLSFSSLCDWFLEIKLSFHLGKEKANSILLGTKVNIKQIKALNIVYFYGKIKQYSKVSYIDYACSAWYPSLRKDLQKRQQVSQNNWIRFCIQLEKKTDRICRV